MRDCVRFVLHPISKSEHRQGEVKVFGESKRRERPRDLVIRKATSFLVFFLHAVESLTTEEPDGSGYNHDGSGSALRETQRSVREYILEGLKQPQQRFPIAYTDLSGDSAHARIKHVPYHQPERAGFDARIGVDA